MNKQNIIYKNVYKRLPEFLSSYIASVYSRKVAKKKYGLRYKAWSEFLDKSQYYEEDRIRAWQIGILHEFMVSAFQCSRYYGFLENVLPEVQSGNLLSGLARQVKIIDKQEVRRASESIRSTRNRRKHIEFLTSGTTGSRLAVYQDIESYQREYAFRWKYLSVGGAKRGDRFAYFIGNNLYEIEKRRPPYHVFDTAENGLYYSIFHIAEWSIKDYIETFNEFKPEYVKGYPSALYDLSMLAKNMGLEVHKPMAIYTASEVLHDFQKLIIEEFFDAPIFQWYGQVENTVNIHECSNHRLHVKEEYGLLELLDDYDNPVAPGELGHAIGTSWGNKAFPLIRYRTGDNMILSKDQHCDCGMNGRLIDRIMGRDEDVIVTPDGRRLGRLDFVFKPIASVKESQIIQKSIDSILIRIVPENEFNSRDEDKLRSIISDYLGPDINISIELQDALPRTNSGKIRYVIS